jgi:hypothetical protein
MNDTLVFGLVAAAVLLAIVVTMRRWSGALDNPFNVRDLVMENGRASRGAVVLLGSFAATTWFFVYYTLTGRMTEGYFGLYSVAWIAPTVARMITSPPPPVAPAAPAVPPKEGTA